MDIISAPLWFWPLATTALFGFSAILLIYWYAHRNHDYWQRRGIPFVKPTPFFGSVLENLRKPLATLEYERYSELGPVYGYFERNTPILVVADPELLRRILVKDFFSFSTRREFYCNDDVLDKMLLAVNGENWKRIRALMTPAFTSGKLKRMIGIFKECSRTLMGNLKILSQDGKPVDVKKLFGAFSMDSIASSAFTTKIDSHNNPENGFVIAARETFKKRANWRLWMYLLFPSLSETLGISSRATEIYFFAEMTLQIMKERQKTGQRRNDFLQLLMDVAEGTEVDNETAVPREGEKASSSHPEGNLAFSIPQQSSLKRLSMNELVAQCVTFFLAGYETVSTTMSYAAYCLALNEDVQDKLRTEVDNALQKDGGELTYETLQSMKYLDSVLAEVLRMYCPVVKIERVAVVDYHVSEYGITIPRGMVISVPIYPLQRDAKHYPNPDVFDPDRFSEEEKAKRDPYTYLPFMVGPRNCIAMRFALVEVKMCLVHLMANFVIKKCPQTKIPLEFSISKTILLTKEIIVSMNQRKDSILIK